MIHPFFYLTAMVSGLGYVLAGLSGAVWALAFSAVASLILYFRGGRWIINSVRAFRLEENHAPEIHGLAAQLAADARLPMPSLYLMPSAAVQMMAFSDCGRCVLVLTRGLFNALNHEEFSAVISWGLARSVQASAAAETTACAFALILIRIKNALNGLMNLGSRSFESRPGFFERFTGWVTIPLAALIVRSVSQSRRIHAADRSAAELCGDPLYLASALNRVDAASGILLRGVEVCLSPLLLTGPSRERGVAALFRIHPRSEKRMAGLEKEPVAGALATV